MQDSPQAFSVPASGNWDGNDGAWSTFVLRVGTPPQIFRVLPSTNGLETWIPVPDQCTQGQGWCGNARGVMPYNGADSSPYSGSPNELQTTSLDPGLTCTANRSPMCINCISVNGKCTNGPCTGRNCCGDPAGSCNGQGCNGLNGICTGPYIGCPCVGPDYNIATNSASSPGILDPLAASGFQANQSSTWSGLGTHSISTENFLNVSGEGQFGADNLGFGFDPSTGLTLNHSLIASIKAKPFYLGTVGLKPANSTSVDNGPATLMSQLKQQNLIPSISYGYTAGAIYRQPPVLGSLTLGGYDTSRSQPNNVSFPLAADDSLSLMVGIKSISASSTLASDQSILSEAITAVVDTTLPFIWLPASACTVFEKAFGLTWDDNRDLYLLNSTSHNQLLNANPTVTFSLANQASGSSLNVTLPYRAFDLQASSPIFSNGTNYFPLKRATSPSQYTLGRTFLQEAFLFVDYEEKTFSISQTQFPSNTSPNLVTIDHSPPPPKSNPNSQGGNSLSRGAIAGAVIGSSVAFVLLCALAIFLFRRHRHRQQRSQQPTQSMPSPSTQGKESWPSSPSDSHAPENPRTPGPAMTENGSGTMISSRSPVKSSDMVGELEDPMTAVTAPSIHWPAPSRPRQELQGSDTAKELPPTPGQRERQREKHVYELDNSDLRYGHHKS